MEHSVVDRSLAAKGVKPKALAEHIAEVKRKALQQVLHAHEAQKASRTGFNLKKLASAGRSVESARKRRRIEGARVPCPRKLKVGIARRVMHSILHI